MIDILQKNDCCGCAACVQRCPRHSIALIEDSEGFLYPHIDHDTCISCGLCETVCPIMNPSPIRSPKITFAAKNRDEAIRLQSSSGGIFYPLAESVIAKGGVVFGAVFDENWEVYITYAKTPDEITSMMGSKYLQARTEHSFKDAETFLKQNITVLYSGTPCQIAALKKYLKKDYKNLLTVDFLCHGVPSPGVWRRYVKEVVTQNRFSWRTAIRGKRGLDSTPSDTSRIDNIEFRNKTLLGWKKYSFVIHKKSTSAAGKNTVMMADMHKENLYMKGFLNDLYLRPSCYHCKCKNGVSQSDITIGDFWGVEQLMPYFDDDKGVGLVTITSENGLKYFESLDVETIATSLNKIKELHLNGGLEEKIIINPQRKHFFELLNSGMPITAIVKQICAPKRTTRQKIKRILRQMKSYVRK